MTINQPISLRVFAITTAVLSFLLAFCGYFLYDARQNLAHLESRLAVSNVKLDEANRSIAQVESSMAQAKHSIAQVESSTAQANRELKGQLAVIRVALQQTTNIRIDTSGAIITRKGTKSNGIELR